MSDSDSWSSFLKSLTYYTGNLYSLTAPPFILSPVSLIEYSAAWGTHPELLIEPSLEKNGGNDHKAKIQRSLAVLKWFISTLKPQYSSRKEAVGSEKKPLNPFLGELFVGSYNEPKGSNIGKTIILTEQVCHHPPITAYYISNDKHGIKLQGYDEAKAGLNRVQIAVRQFGHALLSIDNEFVKEDYLVTLPPLHLEGLFYGKPIIELGGTSYIQASNGLYSVINYASAGYIYGAKNSFSAFLYESRESFLAKEKPVYSINGQWSGNSTIKPDPSLDPETTNNYDKTSASFYDAATQIPQELIVKPLEEQHELESRKTWFKVSNAIREGDIEKISIEKTLIEEAQRAMRKEEEKTGVVWKNRWFENEEINLKDFYEIKNDSLSEDLVSGSTNTTAEFNSLDLNKKFLNLCEKADLDPTYIESGTLIKNRFKKGDNLDNEKLIAHHWRFVPRKWEEEKEVHI